MNDFINKNSKFIILILIIIILSFVGITFAVSSTASIGVNISAGDYAVVYTGSATLPSSKLQPIYDDDLLSSANSSKIMKATFTVKGAANNPTNKNIIYDVSLNNLNMPDELRSKHLKWRLYKNNSLLVEGNFSRQFDAQLNNRMVLTNTQQDLPSYSATADSYTFYVWISEACVGEITECTSDMSISPLVNKTFSGEIRIELSTGSKNTLIRETGSAKSSIVSLGLIDSVKNSTPSFSEISCNSGCGDSEFGIFKAEDNFGMSYYFRGDVENNYVKFANFYWRIIRINGDGSIRVIYDGTSAHRNGEVSIDRQIGTSAYNKQVGDNTYVGYKYGTVGATTYADTHSNLYDSIIKTYLDNWYKVTLKDTVYEQYIVDAIYCNDRSASNIINGTGIGTVVTYYTSYLRLGSGKSPILKCDLANYTNDSFTVDSTLGNGLLRYPVGLITADEIAFAGGTTVSGKNNTEFYLYTGQKYWTMTPYYNFSTSALVFFFNDIGFIDSAGYVGSTNYGVRPVISLRADAITGGSGTMTDPYTIG